MSIENFATHVFGLAPCRYMRIAIFAQISGCSQKAIYQKIDDCIWGKGRQDRQAVDYKQKSVACSKRNQEVARWLTDEPIKATTTKAGE
jgi:glycogen synthase